MVTAKGSCRCGVVSLAIDMEPFLKYNCHCSHCRSFASRFQSKPAPFHGGAAVWKWNIAIQGEEHIEYEQSTSLGGLFAMSRGRCARCHSCVVEKGKRLIIPFCMVMGEPLLPGIKPEVDIFYNSGYKKGPTGSKVIYSDLGSLLYEIFLIVFVAIPLIPWSVFKRLTRGDPFQAKEEKRA